MEIQTPVKLPVYFHTDQTIEYDSIKVDYELDFYEIREKIFFNILSIAPYKPKKGPTKTKVYTSGGDFIVALDPDETENIIVQHMAPQFKISPGDAINNFNDWWAKAGYQFEKYGVERVYANMIWRESENLNNINRLERLSNNAMVDLKKYIETKD